MVLKTSFCYFESGRFAQVYCILDTLQCGWLVFDFVAVNRVSMGDWRTVRIQIIYYKMQLLTRIVIVSLHYCFLNVDKVIN